MTDTPAEPDGPAYPGEPTGDATPPAEPLEPVAPPEEPETPDDPETPPLPVEPVEPPAPLHPVDARPEKLTRAKLLPIEGVIYCLEHTAVHDDTEDPYETGASECSKSEHRPVLYRARKGDIDESVPTDTDEAGLPTAVRTQVLCANGASMTDEERATVVGMLRVQIRKVKSNRTGARKLFGDDYDTSLHDEKLALLEGAARRVGGA
jgi:hypothetical protein